MLKTFATAQPCIVSAHHVQPVMTRDAKTLQFIDARCLEVKGKAGCPSSVKVLKHSPTTWSSSSGGSESAPRLYPAVKHKAPSKSKHRSSSSSRRPRSGQHDSSRRPSSRRRSSSRHRASSHHKDKKTSSHATSTTRASTIASSTTFVDHIRDHGKAQHESELDMIADKVRMLPDPLEQAWDLLRAEYRVQASIWQSLTTVLGGMSGGKPIKDSFASLRRKIESILSGADEDLVQPIELLEELLQVERYQCEWSHAFEAAGHAVSKAEVVSSNRQQLMDYLEEDLDDHDIAGLDTLLLECQFQDCKLEYRVRQVLRLGLRSALYHEVPLFKKQVRFDLAEYCDNDADAPVRESRVSDCRWIPAGGVVSL